MDIPPEWPLVHMGNLDCEWDSPRLLLFTHAHFHSDLSEMRPTDSGCISLASSGPDTASTPVMRSVKPPGLSRVSNPCSTQCGNV